MIEITCNLSARAACIVQADDKVAASIKAKVDCQGDPSWVNLLKDNKEMDKGEEPIPQGQTPFLYSATMTAWSISTYYCAHNTEPCK